MAIDILEKNRAVELTKKLDNANETIKNLNNAITKLTDHNQELHQKMLTSEADWNILKASYVRKIQDLEQKIQQDTAHYAEQGLLLERATATLKTIGGLTPDYRSDL